MVVFLLFWQSRLAAWMGIDSFLLEVLPFLLFFLAGGLEWDLGLDWAERTGLARAGVLFCVGSVGSLGQLV